MKHDGKKEVNRREFLAWAATVAAMLVMPGFDSGSAQAAVESPASGFRQLLAPVSGALENREVVNVPVTPVDPLAPVRIPDPPPAIVVNGGSVDYSGGTSYRHATPASYQASAPAGYQAPVPASYQPVQAAGYQTVPAVVYQPAPVADGYLTSGQAPAAMQGPGYQAVAYQNAGYQATVYQTAVALPQAPQPQPAPQMMLNAAAARQPQPASAGLRAVSRASWSTIPANRQKMRAMNGVNRITIHHEGSAKPNNDTTPNQVAATLRLIQSQHRKRMGAGDIGYHFIIDRTGRIWQGREWAFQGAHTSGANSHNIGVMLLGNFDIQQPTQPQLQSLHSLVGTLARIYQVNPRTGINGHSDFCNTQCPGRYLKPQVQYLRNNL